MSDFDPSREPIFWTSTIPGYNDKDRQRVRFEEGKKIVERVPQRGHMGDYENRRPARGIRSVRVIRHDGNVVDSVLTNGAAHLDPGTPYGQYIQAKWRFFGWFPLGNCPLALIAVGGIEAGHMHDQSLLAQSPCQPRSCSEANPCVHALAELAARRKTRASETAELQSRFRDPSEKMIDAQREQTAVIAGVIADALKQRDPEQPAPKPTKAAKDER